MWEVLLGALLGWGTQEASRAIQESQADDARKKMQRKQKAAARAEAPLAMTNFPSSASPAQPGPPLQGSGQFGSRLGGIAGGQDMSQQALENLKRKYAMGKLYA